MARYSVVVLFEVGLTEEDGEQVVVGESTYINVNRIEDIGPTVLLAISGLIKNVRKEYPLRRVRVISASHTHI